MGGNARVVFTPETTGAYYLSARSQTPGGTGTYTLSVPDPGDSVSEPEGEDFHSDASTPSRVAVNGYVTGEIDSGGDIDGFRVDLEEGVTYVIDLEGAATGRGTLSNPILQLQCPNDFVTDQTSGTGNNARVTITPTETVTYIGTVSSATSGGSGTYTLSVTKQEQ